MHISVSFTVNKTFCTPQIQSVKGCAGFDGLEIEAWENL